mmetsp:Transcript_2770/g.10045  ORF Transcript_2770/g.10045 Transcript_2770/m.10045 type:complete len:326 (+) Transcript_2770:2270-3247(+)
MNLVRRHLDDGLHRVDVDVGRGAVVRSGKDDVDAHDGSLALAPVVLVGARRVVAEHRHRARVGSGRAGRVARVAVRDVAGFEARDAAGWARKDNLRRGEVARASVRNGDGAHDEVAVGVPRVVEMRRDCGDGGGAVAAVIVFAARVDDDRADGAPGIDDGRERRAAPTASAEREQRRRRVPSPAGDNVNAQDGIRVGASEAVHLEDGARADGARNGAGRVLLRLRRRPKDGRDANHLRRRDVANLPALLADDVRHVILEVRHRRVRSVLPPAKLALEVFARQKVGPRHRHLRVALEWPSRRPHGGLRRPDVGHRGRPVLVRKEHV